MSHRKILTFQPLTYHPGDERFLVTNLGALVSAFKAMGHISHQVAFAPEPRLVGEMLDDVLLCSPEQAENSEWWRQHQPWAVVTNTWAAPRFRKYLQAIQKITPRVMDRLDTDGNRSPTISFGDYLYREISSHRDFANQWQRRLALPLALGRTLALTMKPGLIDLPTVEVLADTPLVGIESPLAVERIRRLLRHYGKPASHLHCIPFPIEDSALQVAELAGREKTIVSVGRWNANQKNLPLLLQVLERFLRANPDWNAVLPGVLPEYPQGCLERHAPSQAARIEFPGPMPHKKIYRLLSTSMIFLMTSRHESFGIAAAEALCSGCSVVGPHHIPSIPWFCGSDSGTVAARYTSFDLADALAVEASFWTADQRDPGWIARVWRNRVSSSVVANRITELFRTIPQP